MKEIFERYPEVALVYAFGSRVKNQSGPLSDYDFGVYFVINDRERIFELKLKLLDELSRFLKTDAIDLVILNFSDNPVLNYQIIREGEVIFERKPYRLLLEPKVLNIYFDFMLELKKNHLST
jgi:predicted nucleotidyltransferase